MPKVAISAVSSFTGAWIARAFDLSGYKVQGLCTRTSENEYTGLSKTRVSWASRHAEIFYGMRAEDETMVRWISTHPAKVWVHHHHYMEAFRSQDYDLGRAEAVGIKPLENLCKALKSAGYRGLIFSGSYFEPGEGGKPNHAVVTPYSKSKSLVWKALEEKAYRHGLLLSKIVIPDPVGPMENEDRLIPALIRAAKSKTPFPLKAPWAIADRIPASDLAQVYVEAAKKLINEETTVARPSGFVGTNQDWIELVSSQLLEARLNLDPLKFTDLPKETPDPAKISKLQNPPEEKRPIDWTNFWKTYARWITTNEPWEHMTC